MLTDRVPPVVLAILAVSGDDPADIHRREDEEEEERPTENWQKRRRVRVYFR